MSVYLSFIQREKIGMDGQEKQMIESASAYIDAHIQEMIALWQILVSMESGNRDKEGVDRVCARLAQELERSGAETKIVPMETRGNLLKADFHPERTKAPVLLLGHMDTVFDRGTLEKNPFRIVDGCAYGPGVLDMKAGLVMAVYILRALDACGYGKRPLRVVFAGDEENGHRESTAAEEIKAACEGCAAAFNFETGFPDDGLVVGRMGSCRVTLTVRGVAAHAGNDPERGRSAILEMAHKVIAIQQLNDYEHGLYVNVGLINGGTVVNAVPGSCEIQIDLRYADRGRLDRTLKQIEEIAAVSCVADTAAKMTVTEPSVPMEKTEKNLKLFAHVQETAREIGYGEVTPKTVGGWSDSCLAASCGIPAICGMGVKGAKNHSMEEYAIVSTLFTRTKLALASIIRL